VVAGAPVLHAPQRTLETILDQVVSRIRVAQKRARIAPEAGYFRKDRRPSFVHAGPSLPQIALIEPLFATLHKPGVSRGPPGRQTTGRVGFFQACINGLEVRHATYSFGEVSSV